MKIAITGYGAISAIGLNVAETLTSLENENSGISQGKLSYTSNFKVGEICLSNKELSSKFNLQTTGSRTSLLGMIAAKEAFQGHSLDKSIRTGLISGTSVGGMDISEVEYAKYLHGDLENFKTFENHPSGTTTEQIAKEIGVSDFINTISTACSSAANAIIMGARMIKNGSLDRVVVGGTDALTQFTVEGFNSLMIFDKDWCRPFDESRKGLNLGEGAGFIVLESKETIAKTGQKPLAYLSGYCNTSDAFHQTASSPEGKGAILSMKGALEMANLHPSDINYINAHGTSTPNNDLSESNAIINVFESSPMLSSTKAYTGHTLAASAGIEAIISILSLNTKQIFPNLNFSSPIEETGIIPVTKVEKNQVVNHVMSNAFGFGGNNSTLIFSGV